MLQNYSILEVGFYFCHQVKRIEKTYLLGPLVELVSYLDDNNIKIPGGSTGRFLCIFFFFLMTEVESNF
jgi:hypothetical protein